MNYLLDTNILVLYGRNSKIADSIEKEHGIFNGEHNLAISSVTLGELNSLAKQFKYGQKRKERLLELTKHLFVIDINIQKIIERYGDIDAYSQGKLENKPLLLSSRNMGKNDLWIAATASAYNMELVTSDKDFDHLKEEYIKLNTV